MFEPLPYFSSTESHYCFLIAFAEQQTEQFQFILHLPSCMKVVIRSTSKYICSLFCVTGSPSTKNSVAVFLRINYKDHIHVNLKPYAGCHN
jgi:hypothetical protein